MSTRKDNKGRSLRSGESQRPDGRYEYRYVDLNGSRKSVYSWRLVQSDKVPTGKRITEPLRDMEKSIYKSLASGVITDPKKKITLNSMFAAFMDSNKELSENTRLSYSNLYSAHIKDLFGERSIFDIKYSDIKRFYIKLLTECNLSINTISTINSAMQAAFNIAVRDEILKSNPCVYAIKEVRRMPEATYEKRHALTEEQQNAFIKYYKSKPKYKRIDPLMTFLFGTGCRIGEAIGLTWDDCDFENNVISINHTMSYRKRANGNIEFFISRPKTDAGNRLIPMISAVRKSLLEEKCRQGENGGSGIVVDGYSGFVFCNKRGRLYTCQSVRDCIIRIVSKYNDEEKLNASADGRQPLLLPEFSPHIIRHTFCTRFCERESDIKVIQEIMGHASSSVTMNVYNEATADRKNKGMVKLEDAMKHLS